MQRRDWLMTTGALVAANVLWPRRLGAQPPPGAKASTLERIAIMTLNFQRLLRVPDAPEGPDRTLELFDVGQMIADTYGVHKVEFQHYHLASTEPSYLKELRARLAKSRSRMTQINLEFAGLNISAATRRDRMLAIDLTKMWVDHAVVLGAQRVMINQGAPTAENKIVSIPALKTMADYGRSKGIIVSVETRLTSSGARGAAPPATPPPPPPPSPEVWALLAEIIKGAGAHANVDVGGANAASQDELHQCLRLFYPLTAGTMHTRVNPRWDLATAIRFMEQDLQYHGLYTIEAANGHEGTRQIYDVVVATV